MRAIGIVLAGGGSHRMGDLIKNRAVAAMPVAGGYRSIDFVLSNMSHSNVKKVAILTQYNARSLNAHLNSSKWWDFGRKKGGLYILPPSVNLENNYWYRGTADAIYQNLEFLKESHEPNVVIVSGDCIYKMDYNQVLKSHTEKKADITVVYKELSEAEDDPSRFGVLKLNEKEQIVDFQEKPLQAESNLISLGIYVIRRRLLIDLIEKANTEGRFDFVRDIIIRYKDQKNICGHRFDQYWKSLTTVDAYYQGNMDFLKKEVRDHFFKEEPQVYSKVADLPPAKYNPGSKIKNSLVSSGCIINGEIENSLLFKKVYVGNNCTIKNSIILDDVYIGDNTVIENCIIESRNTIASNMNYVSEDNKPRVIIEDNQRYII